MKRSQINNAIKWAENTLHNMKITLPQFAYWNEGEWKEKKENSSVLIKTMMGWDVTDFGSGDFEKCGAVLFTLRNGSVYDASLGTPYAEKYILLKDGNAQEIPLHYHESKTEDIINRGGGVLCVQLYASDKNGHVEENGSVEIYLDGIKHTFSSGDTVEISAGNSITLTPYVFHRFYAKIGCGDLVVGEVSKINDDNIDNVFANPSDRFCEVEEDEQKYRLLVNEYEQ